MERHAQTILAAFTGATLSSNRYIMKCGLNFHCSVSCFPLLYFALQLFEHLSTWQFTQNSHLFRIEVAVERNDSFERKNRACQRIWRFHWPSTGRVAVYQMLDFLI